MLERKLLPVGNLFVKKIIQENFRRLSTSKALKENHYDVLGLKHDATQAQIKNAYFELSKVYHPDRISATDENLRKFRAITAAYEVLGNEQTRKLYDRGLIGDAGRIEIQETQDTNDPIIKFYKQRQKLKETDLEDLDAWTQQFYETTRKTSLKKNELFREQKHKIVEPNFDPGFYFSVFSFIVMGICYYVSRKNSRTEKFFRKVYSTFS